MGADVPTDRQLAIQCQLGEREAWELLVVRWHPRLHRFAWRMLGDAGAADDLTQEVWLRVVRSLVRLRDQDRLGVWLYRVARMALTDRLRREYRLAARDQLAAEVAAIELDLGFDHKDQIEVALARLNPADREVTVLFYLEERSLSEVAEICGVPAGTVKSRLHRIRRELREHLEQEQGET